MLGRLIILLGGAVLGGVLFVAFKVKTDPKWKRFTVPLVAFVALCAVGGAALGYQYGAEGVCVTAMDCRYSTRATCQARWEYTGDYDAPRACGAHGFHDCRTGICRRW